MITSKSKRLPLCLSVSIAREGAAMMICVESIPCATNMAISAFARKGNVPLFVETRLSGAA